MPDNRFFETLAPITLEETAEIVCGDIARGAPDKSVTSVAALSDDDVSEHIVYCDHRDKAAALDARPVGICLTTEAIAPFFGKKAPIITVADPRLAFAILASRLHRSIGDIGRDRPGVSDSDIDIDGIHPTAVIGDGAKIGAGAWIGPHCVIGPNVEIGPNTRILGHSTVTHALIGAQVEILPGAQIGQPGFGFAPGPEGLVRIPQLGRVIIEDDVEIGANTAIDRGSLGDTIIGRGVKIDNLVQIAHNVCVGAQAVIAAQTGIAGSCDIGRGVMMGGQVGVSDHLSVGDGARLAASAGLLRDVPDGETWGGTPARSIKDWLKETATLSKLAKKKTTPK
ncbi:MAG: UDP-3-O-(3-hydroxymyristoyl)glucosamine N-acyltransferase [Pseudomonadota bacterium]